MTAAVHRTTRSVGRSGLMAAGMLLASLAGSRPALAQEAVLRATDFPDVSVLPQEARPAEFHTLRLVLASALVPGLGQRMQGKRRWIGYVALEAAAVLYHLERKGQGRSLRTAYRDLAWTSARAGTSEPRMDGDFDYYERLSNFSSSGAFDTDPVAPGIQPESRTSTYNGRIWELARGLFMGGNATPSPGDPGWDDAIGLYTERGYGDAFLWDWTGLDAGFAEYRATLRDSDDAFRRATTVLGVVIGNHLVSAIDALLSASTPESPAESRAMELRVTPSHGPRVGSGASWDVTVRIRR